MTPNDVDWPAAFNDLAKQYEIEGPMTLRRCWYVLLSKGHLKERAGTESQRLQPYRYLSKKLLNARIRGKLSWHVIADRTRSIQEPPSWTSVDEAVSKRLEYFSYNPNDEQDDYCEVWIEKDAVSPIVYTVTGPWFVPLIVGKGFSSGTYLHEAAERFNSQVRPIRIIYLSDYDPEGEYFPKLFKSQLPIKYRCKADFDVDKVILTRPQIDEWDLPWIAMKTPKPNHLRKEYVRSYGELNNCLEEGWKKVELDAVSNLDLINLLMKRLQTLLKRSVVEATEQKSLEAVRNWKEQHNLP